MMLFLLGGVIDAIGAAPSAESLAGVSLGATLAELRSEHPDAEVRRNGAGSRWTWKTPAGGTVTVLADNGERVVKVSFMADRGEADSVDLPCVKIFPVQDSHVNFDAAIDQKTCVPMGSNKYRLNDGSILEVFFGDPGDGQLQLVRWYNPREREAPWLPAQVAVSVFECTHNAADPPELRIYDLDKIFAADSIEPNWSFEKPVWKATISVPAGHYILHANTKRCAGESEQLVAIVGHTRHVTMTLDEKQEVNGKIIARIDEDMDASAVYGLLPSAATRIELMSADSLVGEQTRQTGKVDGSIYEFDHLRSGRYVLRATYGDIFVSREVTVPPNEYGATVRADLSPEDASQIVKEQAAGSNFVPVNYNGPPLQTYRIGHASVDGWTTEPLIKPSDYSPSAQRISTPALGAVGAMTHFLNTDSRIPQQFRSLSVWTVEIQAQGVEVIRVDLFANDPAAWLKQAPKTQDLCIPGIGAGDVILRLDSETYKIIGAYVCP
jgi:hypothetical protein